MIKINILVLLSRFSTGRANSTSPGGRVPLYSYRPDIDGLRALAIIAVVCFHAFPSHLSGGFVGVDVFFVISGFLITQILNQQRQQDNFSLSAFYSGRIRRLFPALIIVLSACCTFGWVALLADEYKHLGKLTLASTVFVSNFVLWGETGYFDYAADAKPLLHLWSLGIEGQFYLLWPAVLWMASRARFSALGLCCGLMLVSLALNLVIAPQSPAHAFYSPVTRMWELLSGGLIAQLQQCKLNQSDSNASVSRLSAFKNNALPTIGLVLIVASAVMFDKDLSFPGIWAVVPVAGTILIIMAGEQAWLNRRILSRPVLVSIGLISFPLYLWHWPILSFAKIISGTRPPWEIQAALVTVAFGLAVITYRWVEQPLRFGKNLRQKTHWLIVGMIALASTGSVIFLQDGFARRHQNQLVETQLADLKFDLPDTQHWYCANATPEGPRCHATGPNPSVVVIGDSHALTIYTGLINRFKSKGEVVGLYGASDGCPPLLDVVIQDLGGDSRNCLIKGSQAIRRVISDPSIKQVILMSRGPMYTTAKGYGEVESEQFGSWALHFKDESRGTRTNKEVFALGLARTLDALLSAGKKVTFLHDVPELGFDIRNCFSFRPLAFSSRLMDPCAVSKSAFEERTQAYRLMVNQILAERPAVKVIDAAEALCDETWCYGSKDGVLLYIDDDHLSHRGADYVVKQLWDKF
jgi:peptidoglycan/LPS O-acetylase OafA/YrhL